MKPEQLEALLRYRIEQAHDTLREAEILLNAAALRGTINRAYYAMFYALLALLATKQLGTSKHSGPFPSSIVSSQTANAPSPRPRGRRQQG